MALSLDQKKAVVSEVAVIAAEAHSAVAAEYSGLTVEEMNNTGFVGQVRYRTDKAGIIHCSIGKADFKAADLKENLQALMADLNKLKPASAKGIFMKKVTVSTTMGPGLIVDQATLEL